MNNHTLIPDAQLVEMIKLNNNILLNIWNLLNDETKEFIFSHINLFNFDEKFINSNFIDFIEFTKDVDIRVLPYNIYNKLKNNEYFPSFIGLLRNTQLIKEGYFNDRMYTSFKRNGICTDGVIDLMQHDHPMLKKLLDNHELKLITASYDDIDLINNVIHEYAKKYPDILYKNMDVLSQLRLKNIKEHIKNDPYLKDNALYYLPQGNQEIKVKLIALIKDNIRDIKEFILKYRLYRKGNLLTIKLLDPCLFENLSNVYQTFEILNIKSIKELNNKIMSIINDTDSVIQVSSTLDLVIP